jgi:hypothetical protein
MTLSILAVERQHLIRVSLEDLQPFKARKYREAKAEHSSWFDQTAMILRRGFGESHSNFFDFQFSGHAVGEYDKYAREEVKEQSNFEARISKEESCLNTYMMELKLMLPEPSHQTVQSPSPRLDAHSQALFLCRRFPRFAIALANRLRNRTPVVINDEYDVQYLLNALLRFYFNDVRTEEGTGSYAGGSARMDFLLKAEEIVIEAKMTRSNLKDREVGDELLQDVVRYKQHPNCKQLICLIYDPAHLIANPHGLQGDLEQMSTDRLRVNVVIVPES